MLAAVLPGVGQATGSVFGADSPVPPLPQGLTPAQRDGITGKTADLGSGYYLNPILAGDYSDPAVWKDGKDYYMSHSMSAGLKPGILIWHSRDLVNWEPVCRALKTTTCSVPEIVKYKAVLHLFHGRRVSGDYRARHRGAVERPGADRVRRPDRSRLYSR
jgi:hypothetical protein